MNCFVIMPFDREFDDVYSSIKVNVEDALAGHQVKCFRLDEARPAGRITDRLLREIQAAALCVADLTGNKSNVMWEVGYAMALGKPVVIITQQLDDLPFDIKDMQSLEYKRNHLSETLGRPLRKILIDTIQAHAIDHVTPSPTASNESKLVGDLLEEIKSLRSMISQLVKTWKPEHIEAPTGDVTAHNLSALEGAWVDRESGSHFYVQLINGDLVGPYCYAGDEELTAVFYSWKKMGEFWFARFSWFKQGIAGFALLKHQSVDVLTGAWWYDYEFDHIPATPIRGSGVPAVFERRHGAKFPAWATRYLEDIRRKGLGSLMSPQRSGSGKWST